jgi:signal transduction histidine kinase
MTHLKQFVTSVTGSDLSKQFQIIRIKLTLFSVLILCMLLFFNGLNILNNTKNDIEQIKIVEPASFRRFDDIFTEIRAYNQKVREENIIKIQNTIAIQNTLLMFVLTILTWFVLYYLLKPISDTYIEKDKFLKYASHELRTPLSVLKSDIQLTLLESELIEVQKSNKNSLIEIDRLKSLVDSFLENFGKQNKNWTTANLDIKGLLEQVWKSLQNQNSHNLKLKINVEKTVYWQINKATFYQLMYNLIGNILKYSTPDTEVQIEISSSTVILQNLTHIKKFELGIGLTIVNELAHNLDLKVENSLEKGIFVTNIQQIN